jgi:hypothetical protein
MYIIIYITKLKSPLLTLGARERGMAIVAHKRIQNPPLAFEARKGVVIAIVTHKRTPDPPHLHLQ